MTQIIDINNLDIETVSDELLQAILIAVFTDARAADDELPEYVNRKIWPKSFMALSLLDTGKL